jgi:imidazolonepropionase-like amidohydrolase
VVAGADTVEHGNQLDDEAIEMMKKKGTFLVPTLMVSSEEALASIERAGAPEHIMKRMHSTGDLKRSSFQKAHRAGVRIAMGTDTYRRLRWHWGKQALELELMANLGMSNMETIVASTKTASEALGIEALTGTIEKGKEADILLVDGNPLKDIKVLQDRQKILMVMKGGKLEVDRTIRRST